MEVSLEKSLQQQGIEIEHLIIAKRNQIGDLNRLIRNYRRDSDDRNIRSVLTNTINKFNKCIRAIMENDQEFRLRHPTNIEQTQITEETFVKLVNLVEATLNEVQSHSFQLSASGLRSGSLEKIMGLTSSSDIIQQQAKSLRSLTSNLQKIPGSLPSNNLLNDIEISSDQHSDNEDQLILLYTSSNELMECSSMTVDLDGAINLDFIGTSMNILVTSRDKIGATYSGERSARRKFQCIPCVLGECMKRNHITITNKTQSLSQVGIVNEISLENWKLTPGRHFGKQTL